MVCAITGASGYVGSRLMAYLARSLEVVPITRRDSPDSIRWDMSDPTDISGALAARRVKTLVHAAWDFSHPNPKENERVNVEGSRRLFESAAKAGVERITFLSTISAFTGARSMYGQSKMRVEELAFSNPIGYKAVIRPGLVWGDGSGGMFGALTKQVNQGFFVPLIGSGRYPQYLVHEEDLGNAILRAACGPWQASSPVTLAHPQPWLLRDLIQNIARDHNRKVTLVPLPWRVIYAGLKAAELAGAKLSFRSDSVLSLIYQDAAPDFTLADSLELTRHPYLGHRR